MKKSVELIKFQNALTEMLVEIEKSPDDSIQDIANESLERWECGFTLDSHYCPRED